MTPGASPPGPDTTDPAAHSEPTLAEPSADDLDPTDADEPSTDDLEPTGADDPTEADAADHDELEPIQAEPIEVEPIEAEPTEAEPLAGATTVTAPARWSERDRGRERELIRALGELSEHDPQRAAVRDEMVTMHLPLASFLARRFRDRGESMDDLTQVATIGLIKAVDRFDGARGVEFSTFATPTIAGEIKRHFRDKGWAIRVPRRLQELRISIGRATAELSQSTGRSPTVAELAAHLGVSDDEILEGMESAQAYATLSLDASSTDDPDEGAAALVETLGEDDPGLNEVETRETLHPLVATLPVREQRILYMRFYENLTQSQIAERIGVSQMHVSRLLSKSLAQLRGAMAEPLA